MTSNKNLSLALSSFSLAIFVFAKFIFLMRINSIVISALITAGLGFALVALIISLVHSFTAPMSPETTRMVRGVQIAAILALIISLLTGGFGSLLAGYIHF
ncbi:hypothetical protein IKF89_03440 [Candidatus Saccharibacteria bacterium]|nr:hypothetical protein [Candidatus Saccharibacteria bacterium]